MIRTSFRWVGWKGNEFFDGLCSLRGGLGGSPEADERHLGPADESEEDRPRLAVVFPGDFCQRSIEEAGKAHQGLKRCQGRGASQPLEGLPGILPEGSALLLAAHLEETEETARLGSVELRQGDGESARRLLLGG
jgi:hypothetical protein